MKIRIRIEHPIVLRAPLQAGDEVVVHSMTPEIDQLLAARRLDNAAVATIVDDGEEQTATVTKPQSQTATTSRRAGNAARSETVPQ